MAPRLELFPFRFREPVTRKRGRARYRAELREIVARRAEFEIIGPPEICEIDLGTRHFKPMRDEQLYAEALDIFLATCWTKLGLVGWALGLVFALIRMRMAGDQDRAARHRQKRIDPYSDMTITH